MTREQAINYLISSGFTDEQVSEVVRALTYEPTTKNDLGVDCISRADALNEFCIYNPYDSIGVDKVRSYLKALPSVTPQEPQTGHWIVAKGGSYLGMRNGCCSNCKDFYTNDWNVMNYCPHCGAKMVEPQESEVNNG